MDNFVCATRLTAHQAACQLCSSPLDRSKQRQQQIWLSLSFWHLHGCCGLLKVTSLANRSAKVISPHIFSRVLVHTCVSVVCACKAGTGNLWPSRSCWTTSPIIPDSWLSGTDGSWSLETSEGPQVSHSCPKQNLLVNVYLFCSKFHLTISQGLGQVTTVIKRVRLYRPPH